MSAMAAPVVQVEQAVLVALVARVARVLTALVVFVATPLRVHYELVCESGPRELSLERREVQRGNP